jgi:hypothetical protein
MSYMDNTSILLGKKMPHMKIVERKNNKKGDLSI